MDYLNFMDFEQAYVGQSHLNKNVNDLKLSGLVLFYFHTCPYACARTGFLNLKYNLSFPNKIMES